MGLNVLNTKTNDFRKAMPFGETSFHREQVIEKANIPSMLFGGKKSLKLDVKQRETTTGCEKLLPPKILVSENSSLSTGVTISVFKLHSLAMCIVA